MQAESGWARMSQFMGGNQRGAWFLPELDDEVLVAFVGGDPNMPVVLGGMWNGQDTPPQNNDDGDNNIKQIKTRTGLTLTFDDKKAEESVRLETPNGNSVKVSQANGIEISVANSVIHIENGLITIETKNSTVIKSGKITLTAPNISLDADKVICSKTLECEALMATTEIAENYTPGGGNII